jgi:hypothetical protein
VGKQELFQTNDLWEKKDMANFTNTMFALGRAVSYHAFFLAKRIFSFMFILIILFFDRLDLYFWQKKAEPTHHLYS